MSEHGRENNLALFIDFDNVALGARDSRMRFDVKLLLHRVLEKGKVLVKRAYADWHYYKEHMTPLHESAIELIEVPAPRISGKNSADIRLVVDAIDLCYSKTHIDTFVIVSGDSDFSPLVSKLRENDKQVIGIGVRSSSSNLLIGNCDEFLFYDDIYHSAVSKVGEKVGSVPENKRQLFDFLLQTTQGLLQESRGVLYSSLVKDTMKRKQPEFNEANYGYGTFGELLEEAHERGLLEVERDSRAGGTLVVLGLGKGELPPEKRGSKSRRRRRGGSGRREERRDGASAQAPAEEPDQKQVEVDPVEEPSIVEASAEEPTQNARRRRGRKKAVRNEPTDAEKAVTTAESSPEADPVPPGAGVQDDEPAQKAARKTTATKKATKKTIKKAAKKTTKKTAKKTAKKSVAKKAARKTTTSQKAARKASARRSSDKAAPGDDGPPEH